ncbi:hypothetical protein DPMN_078214 [Dreissena polymorpha]|uniref:Uncharacterized protein n=1 Tax=Dreissena polymorpha TaxID=45954 RepID=A0A9D3YS25_DREPO|nr:hypothetical protein DPMN_078214 [Dreissena polymorpha]
MNNHEQVGLTIGCLNNHEKVGLTFGCMSILVDILGIAIPFWSYNGAGGNSGLWLFCGSTPLLGGYTCLPYITVSVDLKAVRGIMIVGLLVMIAPVVIFLLKKFLLKDMAILFKVISYVTGFAMTLNVFGVVIYGIDKNLNVPGTHLHIGFALCIVAAVFCFVGGVFMAIDKDAVQPKCEDVCPIKKCPLF